MKIVAIIQARMGATRLPGKILKQVSGKTILGHMLARVMACRRLDRVVVATTTAPGDDTVVAECEKYGGAIFRGSETDVLSRYYGAAAEYQADVIVRITSDCPLYDPELLARMLAEFERANAQDGRIDYLSNILERTFPRGLDTEIFNRSTLEQAHREAGQPLEREHVTPFIYRNPQRFVLRNYGQPADLSSHRWTLDTEDDLRFVQAVYAALYRRDQLFSTQDVLKLLEARPELTLLNCHVEQKQI
jgi:spore coat polysaccharide biosynthesis protein SpsF